MIGFLVWLGAMAGLRVSELLISAKNRRGHGGDAQLTQESIYPWMVVLHVSFFVVQPLELWWFGGTFGGWISWTAIALVIIAELLRGWVLASMGRAWNVRVIHGEDYPIVSHGPYRYIRHPNYLVVILEMAFVPLIMHLWWSAAFLTLANAIILKSRIATEEKVLAKNPRWRAEMAIKPRFIPGTSAPEDGMGTGL